MVMPLASADAATKPKVYKSCTALNKAYPKGIARKGAKDKAVGGHKAVTGFKVNTALYNANKKLDKDKDGIACEKTGAKLPYKVHAVATYSGTGLQNTTTFTVHTDPWGVAWAYNSDSSDGECYFGITVYSGNSEVDLAANAVETGDGSGSNLMYLPAGTYHLQIDSECAYAVGVVG